MCKVESSCLASWGLWVTSNLSDSSVRPFISSICLRPSLCCQCNSTFRFWLICSFVLYTEFTPASFHLFLVVSPVPPFCHLQLLVVTQEQRGSLCPTEQLCPTATCSRLPHGDASPLHSVYPLGAEGQESQLSSVLDGMRNWGPKSSEPCAALGCCTLAPEAGHLWRCPVGTGQGDSEMMKGDLGAQSILPEASTHHSPRGKEGRLMDAITQPCFFQGTISLRRTTESVWDKHLSAH